MKSLHLKPGRDKSVRRRHPWIFSGAVERVDGEPASGETVLVKSAGQPLAVAAWSPKSQICARVWSFDCSVFVDKEFFRGKMEQAVALRGSLPASRHCNAMRLVHGESDGLPGLVVDRYDDVLVAQFLSAGAEHWRETILDLLVEVTNCASVYERSDADVRKLEGLESRAGFARGNREAKRCPIVEHGLNFRVDVEAGQKTGFFLDQRDNRLLVRRLAKGRTVLNCFAFTGGFSVAAALGGATSVFSVDQDADAIALARENFTRNGLVPEKHDFLAADVFELLGSFKREGRSFDLVVLDPPAFAKSQRAVDAAIAGYASLNRQALALVRKGGLVCTASCSARVSPEAFFEAVKEAGYKAGVDLALVEERYQPADHPIRMQFREGRYLKFLVLEVR